MKHFFLIGAVAMLMAPSFAQAQGEQGRPTYEQLQQQVEFLTLALDGAKNQRDAAMRDLQNSVLQAAINTEMANRTAARATDKKSPRAKPPKPAPVPDAKPEPPLEPAPE